MTVTENTISTPDTGALLERIDELEKRLSYLEASEEDDKVSIVVFSGDLDRVLAGFVIATGAAGMGMQVDMFFTFWGLTALKKSTDLSDKSLFQKAMGMMTPASSEGLPVSRMNYFGAGAKMLRAMMKQQNVQSLEEFIQLARDLGVTFISCEMSQNVMGIRDEELIDDIEHGGVATFLASALQSRSSFFI